MNACLREKTEGSLEEIQKKEQKKLKLAIITTGSLVVLEVFGGIISNSLALLSDAWHMFVDASALATCFLAGELSSKNPTSDKTFGYHRVEILSALANGVLLVVLSAYIFYEAIQRLFLPAQVKGLEMLVITTIGLVGNALSMGILSGGVRGLNVKAALLHVTSDALSSVGAIVAGLVIIFTNWYPVDPIVSIMTGSFIVYGSVKMLREVLHILLEGVPISINLNDVVGTMMSVSGVKEVHDVHIWSITSYRHYLSAHLVLRNDVLSNVGEVLNETKRLIDEKYGIRHTTIQVEPESYEEVGEVHRQY
jgi:cobalt-zinc-cadmium efflux system protein